MILLDTSALYSAIDAGQPEHARVRDALRSETGALILSPLVLGEIDYFILTRMDLDHELRFLGEVAAGAYELAGFGAEDVGTARTVVEKYRDLEIGLTDASIVVLAARYDTDRVLTLDERHFRALRTLDGRPFTILPADRLTGASEHRP